MTTEKHFLDESKEQQEAINERDLKELKHYYGSWDEVRKVIERLENDDKWAAWERAQNRDL